MAACKFVTNLRSLHRLSCELVNRDMAPTESVWLLRGGGIEIPLSSPSIRPGAKGGIRLASSLQEKALIQSVGPNNGFPLGTAE